MAELPQNVIDARNAAQQAASSLGQFQSKGYTIEDDLKKAAEEALNYNKDIVGLRSQALGDYLAAPSAANVRYGVQQFSQGSQAGQANPDFVWNPFERNKLIQGEISNKMIPFSTYNTLLGMREGQVGDIVGAGTRAFQAQQAAAQANAGQARQYYSDVLGEFTTLQDIAAKEQQLQQEQQRIDLAKAEAAKKAAGGGIDPFGFSMGMGGGGQAPQQTQLKAPLYESNVEQQIPAEWTQPNYLQWAGENAMGSLNNVGNTIGNWWNEFTGNTPKVAQAQQNAPWYLKWAY